MREDEEGDDLGTAADSGNLDDTAEGDEAKVDDDIEGGEGVGLGEGPEDEGAGAEDGSPFEDGVESDEADVGGAPAGGEAGGEVGEGTADFSLEGGGQEGESVAEALREGVTAAGGGYQNDEADRAEEGDEKSAGLEDPLEGGADGSAGGVEGGEADSEQQEGGEEVVDAFEQPGGHLGGEGYLFRAGDEVGANEFSGAAEQGDGGKADEGIAEDAPEGGVGIDATEHHLPAEGAGEVAGKDDGGAGEHPAPVDLVIDLGEGGPIESRQALPGEPEEDRHEQSGRAEGTAAIFRRKERIRQISGYKIRASAIRANLLSQILVFVFAGPDTGQGQSTGQGEMAPAATVEQRIWAAAHGLTPPIGGNHRLDQSFDFDLRLVERCLAGEETAWEDLVRTHSRRVYSICYRFTGTDSEAQDLTQEVFLRLFKTLRLFRAGEGSFAVWLARMTRNLLIDHYRRTKANRVTDSIEDQLPMIEARTAGQRGGADGLLAGREASELLQAALQKLSPELRETVILRDLEELDYKEIAAVLNVPEGTVKSRLNRGRAELARLLKRHQVALV